MALSVAAGAVLGVVVVEVSSVDQQQSFTADVIAPAALVECPAEIDTTGWIRYRNKELGFELFYPPGFSVEDRAGSLILSPFIGGLPLLTFSKIRSRLADITRRSPYQFAGYKVSDRQSLVLATPQFSSDYDMLSSTYLFIRDFQTSDPSAQLSMLKVDILDANDNPVFAQARAAGIADVESVLTPAQQILSTLRLLSYAELYGPAGFQNGN